MSETAQHVVSEAELLKRRARANRDNQKTQVSSDTLRLVIADFLTKNEAKRLVQGTFPAKYTSSAATARFKKIILEDDLSELVWVLDMDGATLINVIDEPEPGEDEDEDN